MNKIEIPNKIKRLMKKYSSSYGTVYETFIDENEDYTKRINCIVGVVEQIEALQCNYVCDSEKGYKDLDLIKKWLYYVYSSQFVDSFK